MSSGDRFGVLDKFLRSLPVVHDPRLRNEARADEITGKIRVGDDFMTRPADLQRAELTHEAAHHMKMDDWYLKNKSDWDLSRRIDYGHLNGQETPGEILAEAYATHWTDPEFLHQHAPTLVPLVREAAKAVGLPLPPHSEPEVADPRELMRQEWNAALAAHAAHPSDTTLARVAQVKENYLSMVHASVMQSDRYQARTH